MCNVHLGFFYIGPIEICLVLVEHYFFRGVNFIKNTLLQFAALAC